MGHGKNTTGDCRGEKRRTELMEQRGLRLLLSAVGLKYIRFWGETGWMSRRSGNVDPSGETEYGKRL